MSPLIKTNDLGKTFGDFTAVNGLNLGIEQEEIFALLGPNGAGKTTTIRMLMGILAPTKGSAVIKDLDCFTQRDKVMRYVGYLPDEPVFYDYLKGREIIQFGGEMHGLSDEEIKDLSGILIEKLGLENDLEEYATNYSKGMKKKLALVLCLMPEPELLILDEPTYGLDPYATRVIHTILKERVQQGASIFFSTHLLDQAEKMCTRVGIMYKGDLAADGDLAELKKTYAGDETLEEIFFSVTAPEPFNEHEESEKE
jgi:ABC-2 type transport system ATP-binding protein